MNIAISTIHRETGNYIDQTIKAIRAEYDGPIHLVMGGKDHKYLDKYKEKDSFIKHEVNEEGLKLNVQRAAKGYYDALTIDRYQDLLVLEDDHVFHPGWYKYLTEFRKTVKDFKFIITFTAPYVGALQDHTVTVPTLQPMKYMADLYWDENNRPVASILMFSNTSAVFYSAPFMQHTNYPEFIYEYAVKGESMYDLLAGAFLFKTRIPIYIIYPSMIDNIGKLSAIGAVSRGMSPDFQKWTFKM